MYYIHDIGGYALDSAKKTYSESFSLAMSTNVLCIRTQKVLAYGHKWSLLMGTDGAHISSNFSIRSYVHVQNVQFFKRYLDLSTKTSNVRVNHLLTMETFS